MTSETATSTADSRGSSQAAELRDLHFDLGPAGRAALAPRGTPHYTYELAGMVQAGPRALEPFEGAVGRTLAVLEPFVAQMKLQRLDRGDLARPLMRT